MADIAALKILKGHIDSFTKLPDPPTTPSDVEFEKYRKFLEQVLFSLLELDFAAHVRIGRTKGCESEGQDFEHKGK